MWPIYVDIKDQDRHVLVSKLKELLGHLKAGF